MTVTLMDAQHICEHAEVKEYIPTPELVYADDTVLLGSCPQMVQR